MDVSLTYADRSKNGSVFITEIDGNGSVYRMVFTPKAPAAMPYIFVVDMENAILPKNWICV